MPPPVIRVALFLAGYLVVVLGASALKGMSPPQYADLVWGTSSSLALIALTSLFLRREKRTFADVAMRPDRRTMVRLLVALIAGAALYPVTLWLISTTVTPLKLSSPVWPTATGWLQPLSAYLALACMEELGFRAYALRTLVSAIGKWKAQLAIALAFGLSHMAYGWSLPSVLLGVIPSGLLFGAVALRRGGLASAIGVHAAINLAQLAFGAKETAGLWTIDAAPADTARLATSAPFIAAAVTLLAAGLVSWWPVTRDLSAESAAAA